jgi:GT2 family glycosyltransferase
MTAAVSLIIPTRNRAALLTRMLRSLDRALAAVDGQAEVVVADNGSTDTTAAAIADWIARGPGRRSVFVGEPGRSRAMNRALEEVRAPLIAFTDDDVEVRSDWLQEILRFFAEHAEYGAAMGRVLMPPEVTDPALLARIAYFGTLPFFDRGDAVLDGKHLYGCNMVVRRVVLDRVGTFNERLGVGASGLHEDGDLARRILQAGERIGYMPNVVVYHAVEPERLTLENFRVAHLRRARSRFEMDPDRGWGSRLAHWVGAVLLFVWWSLLRNRRRIMRARGQVICHTELLRLQWRRQAQAGR